MRTRRFLYFLWFFLSAPLAKPQAGRLPISSIDTIAGSEATNVPGPEFSLPYVSGLAEDSDGNVYFSIQAKDRVYRLGVDGRVNIFLGSRANEKSTIGGVSGIASLLHGHRALTVDASNSVYVVCGNTLVRIDAATGLISTVFTIPYTSPGASDSILNITEMAVGPDGNLYLIDGSDYRIKTYSFVSGAVTILAGNGTRGPAQPEVPAISSPLKYPRALTIGSDGTVYFSTEEPCVFRLTSKDGRLRAIEIALAEEKTPLGDYDIPSSIALDERGHLFVAQANRSRVLRIVLKTGAVSVYVGTGAQGFNGDGIPAHRATVTGSNYVLSDPAGNLIISGDYRIRSVDSSTRLISTIVGNGHAVMDDAHAPALQGGLWEPANAIPAPDGSVFITSSFGDRLLRLDRHGELASLAGGGKFTAMGSEPGPSTQVALSRPQGIWLDKNNEVFFSDDDIRIIRHLIPEGGEVTNFATTPKNFHSSGGILQYAGALVADEDYFYLSDPNGGCVWRVSRKDGTVELYIGKSPDIRGPARGADATRLAAPSGLALDSTGNLYVADGYLEGKEGRILRVDVASRSITTILSNLLQPSGLAFQSPEVLCFSESGGHQVQCLNLGTHTVKVVAGTGEPGFSGDDGPAECAQLNRPSGISFDQNGELYIADTGNQRVRRVHMGMAQAGCHSTCVSSKDSNCFK